jgi:hypothetical protein
LHLDLDCLAFRAGHRYAGLHLANLCWGFW